jgi:FlaA1/EpsC-like NDP-sugar epimerase
MNLSNIFDRLRSRLSAMIHDLVMVPVAWLVAYLLRFNLETVPDVFMTQALKILPLVVVIQGAAFLYFGLYRGVW